MECVILAKTRMTEGYVCVGGLLLNGRMIRLLDENGYNQPVDTEFSIGDVWDIEFSNKWNIRPPHVEDVLVGSINFLDKSIENLSQYIQGIENIPIWRGAPDNLFEGLLRWTSGGSGYISEDTGIPNFSVGFWISNQDLTYKDFYGPRFQYPNIGFGWRSFKYVGTEENIPNSLSAGTLLRVSLARWWSDDEGTEERCYLQLSGWYFTQQNDRPSWYDDIPGLTEEDIPY